MKKINISKSTIVLGMLFFILSVILKAGGISKTEKTGYFVNPIFVKNDKEILTTNESYSSLYLISVKNGKKRELISELGCGFRPALNNDGDKLGIKLIRNDKQIPCTISLETGKIKKLHEPTKLAGEVSFSSDGKVAFTIGEDLVIINKSGDKKFINLGSYINIAPISPDGTKVAFSDADGKLYVIEIESGSLNKITKEDDNCYKPRWSPDSKKILCTTINGRIKVFELKSDIEYALGKGSNPHWAPDGKYICYNRKKIKPLKKLLGSEIYIVSYDGEEEHKITNSKEIYEMNPSFSSDGKSIVFDAYKKRKIFIANLDKNYQTKNIRLIREENKALKIRLTYWII